MLPLLFMPLLLASGIMANFTRNTFLFKASWISKAMAAVFLLLSCLGTKGRADEKLQGKTRCCWVASFRSTILLFGSDVVRDMSLSPGLATIIYAAAVSGGDKADGLACAAQKPNQNWLPPVLQQFFHAVPFHLR